MSTRDSVPVAAPFLDNPDTNRPLGPVIALPGIILADPDGDEQLTATLELDTEQYYASIYRNGAADNLYIPVIGERETTGSITQVNRLFRMSCLFRITASLFHPREHPSAWKSRTKPTLIEAIYGQCKTGVFLRSWIRTALNASPGIT